MVRSVLLAALFLAASFNASAHGAVLMDQIGPNGTFQEGLSNNSTQISNIYASAPQFNISVADDFSITEPTSLQSVEAALFASNANAGFSGLTALRINVFSAQPTAVNFASGNLLSVDVALANITMTSPWTSNSLSRLASMDISASNLTLNPGTYWLSVIAHNSSFSTDIGVLMSSFAGSPGNDNARQIGSGLWGGGGDRALNTDAAFRINGVPVPEPSALLLMGTGGILLAVRRRRI